MGYPMIYWPRAFRTTPRSYWSVLVGLWARERKVGAKIGAAIATPFLFFLTSNFAVWLFRHESGQRAVRQDLIRLDGVLRRRAPVPARDADRDWSFMALFAVSAFLLHRASANGRTGWSLMPGRDLLQGVKK